MKPISLNDEWMDREFYPCCTLFYKQRLYNQQAENDLLVRKFEFKSYVFILSPRLEEKCQN